jgi:hypothetical protein
MIKHTKAELEAIISYLEKQLQEKENVIKQLQVYEQHFKSCRTASPLSPLPDHDNHSESSLNNISFTRLSPPTLVETPAGGRGSADSTDSTLNTVLADQPNPEPQSIMSGK